MSRGWNRPGSLLVACVLVASIAGCAPFDLGSHETLDSWYVGKFEAFDVEEIGFQGLDGGFVGYCVNDVVIRAPVYIVYEALWIAVLPVALPYYGYKFVARDGSPPPEEPMIDVEDDPMPEETLPADGPESPTPEAAAERDDGLSDG